VHCEYTDRYGYLSHMPQLVPAAALVVFWSSGFMGARLGTEYAPADTLLAWRYLAAAAVLAVAWATGIRPSRAAWRRQGVLGLLCQVGYLGGTVTGIGLGVAAGTAALIAAAQPLVVAALAGPVLGEVVDRRQWWALGGGLLGVGLVVGGDLGADPVPWWTYLLPLAGMLALSVGTVLGRRWQSAEGVLESLTLQTLVAAVAFVAAAAGRSTLSPPDASGFWWSVGWVICLSSFGGYGAYLLVLQRQRRHHGQYLAVPHAAHHHGVGLPHVRRPRHRARPARPRRLRGRGGGGASRSGPRAGQEPMLTPVRQRSTQS